MAVLFTVLIPVLMLGVVLALGRYEELLLPAAEPVPADPRGAPGPLPAGPPLPAVPDARKQPGARTSGPGGELSSAA
ncbi:hypothetical protein AB0G32_25980 [Streptomyces sp. NPDC023723]|uniref:hypothetical protein n=1 Tax=Streptomyces sp. NPDC023723 TaxID=3154323 RepID=UPI0033EBBFA9